MKTLTLVAVIAILFSCQKEITINKANASNTSSAVQVTHANFTYPLDEDIYNPCTGEYVHLSGILRIQSTDVITKDLVNSTGTIRYDSLTAIGNVSHMVYRGTGQIHLHAQHLLGDYYTVKNTNYSNRVKLIVPGADNNLTFLHTFKVVVDANGNIRVEDEKLIYADCH
jgi:hypothetical protein